MNVKFLLLLAAVALATETAMAIDCYQCSSVNIPGLPVQKDCDNFPAAKYKKACAVPADANACVTVAGKISGKDDTGKDVTYEGTLRDCATADKADCLGGQDALNVILTLLGLPKDDSLSFNGNMCFCKGDNCNGAGAVKPLALLLGVALAAKHLLC